MNIPAYPSLRYLEIDDKPSFDEAFKSNPPLISEFTFTNLYSWRKSYNLKVSSLGNFLLLCSDTPGLKKFLDPIGNGEHKQIIERILEDKAGIFIRVPEKTKLLFENDKRFKIEPERENFDYLYNAEDLIFLSGKKYDGKRNLIKKFKSTHAYEYIDLTPSNICDCIKFVHEWCITKDCEKIKGLSDELAAVKEILRNFSNFNLIGGAIKYSGKIYAVAIAEKLNPQTLVMHILKAKADVTGLYQAVSNEFLKFNAAGFKYVNLEQDLGIEGLRKSKLSYHPVEMIKKYSIEPNT